MPRRAPHSLASIVLTALLGSGCAALTAPFTLIEPPEGSDQDAAPETASRELALTALEARPAGMLVSMSWGGDAGALDGAQLELFRAEEDEDPILFYRVTLEGDALGTLSERGLVFYDKEVEPGRRYRYILRVVTKMDEEQVPLETILAPPVDITWAAPEGAPEEVTARSDFPDVVELRWTPKPGWSVLVFRRPLGERPRRLAELGRGMSDGVAMDHDVEPGRTYAYRIAYVREDEGYPIFGRPSSEVYVSVPMAEDVGPAPPETRPASEREETSEDAATD